MGITIFQGEFEFLVLQYQMAYYPILVMLSAGFVLVAARIALGPWGAFKTTLFYLGVRGFLVWIVSGALNHTVVGFATYLVPGTACRGGRRHRQAGEPAEVRSDRRCAARHHWSGGRAGLDAAERLDGGHPGSAAEGASPVLRGGNRSIADRYPVGPSVRRRPRTPQKAVLPKGSSAAAVLAVIVVLAVPASQAGRRRRGNDPPGRPSGRHRRDRSRP